MTPAFPPRSATLAAALLAGLLALGAAPAQASLLDISYSGTVTALTPVGMPDGVVVGDIASIHLRLDTDSLIDITAPVNHVFGRSYGLVQATRLDAPDAWLAVQIHGHAFKQTDRVPYRDTPGIGITGPFAYFVDGSFAGISYFGVYAGNGFTTKGLSGEPSDFVGGVFSDAVSGPSYTGSFDPGSLHISAVPEPASALMIVAGLAALSLRRSRATA